MQKTFLKFLNPVLLPMRKELPPPLTLVKLFIAVILIHNFIFPSSAYADGAAKKIASACVVALSLMANPDVRAQDAVPPNVAAAEQKVPVDNKTTLSEAADRVYAQGEDPKNEQAEKALHIEARKNYFDSLSHDSATFWPLVLGSGSTAVLAGFVTKLRRSARTRASKDLATALDLVQRIGPEYDKYTAALERAITALSQQSAEIRQKLMPSLQSLPGHIAGAAEARIRQGVLSDSTDRVDLNTAVKDLEQSYTELWQRFSQEHHLLRSIALDAGLVKPMPELKALTSKVERGDASTDPLPRTIDMTARAVEEQVAHLQDSIRANIAALDNNTRAQLRDLNEHLPWLKHSGEKTGRRRNQIIWNTVMLAALAAGGPAASLTVYTTQQAQVAEQLRQYSEDLDSRDLNTADLGSWYENDLTYRLALALAKVPQTAELDSSFKAPMAGLPNEHATQVSQWLVAALAERQSNKLPDVPTLEFFTDFAEQALADLAADKQQSDRERIAQDIGYHMYHASDRIEIGSWYIDELTYRLALALVKTQNEGRLTLSSPFTPRVFGQANAHELEVKKWLSASLHELALTEAPQQPSDKFFITFAEQALTDLATELPPDDRHKIALTVGNYMLMAHHLELQEAQQPAEPE